MKTDELRESYLAFFESKGCVRRPSDVLVPRWDPSVLFTPAGMNQFKDHFLGRCKLDFTRATTCQKCLRTGDIDNVGRTPRHHTFFEMLGNFSFGDYFKREAIHWAWEFLTSKKWLAIDPARLHVTIYQEDDEAGSIWTNEVGVPANKVIRMGEDDNFWPASAPSQGPDGVCGPCSEIFYHHDDGSEVEIWNLVFTQFNRVGPPPNNLRALPSKNIDTGMGLERTAAMLQGVSSNFHIDILRPLVEAVGDVCKAPYAPDSDNGRRMRRIADHVRACTFAIHENVIPGPNKEKYVIKRLLRRAVLDGRQIGVAEPFLHKLVGKVAELMAKPYPELAGTVERVAQVIKIEESNFFTTIDAGLERIGRLFASMKSAQKLMVSGQDAAEMYTTYGFPPELFETLAAEQKFTFDWPGYKKEMERHAVESGGGVTVEVFASGPMDAIKKAMAGSEFVGYETLEATAKVVGLISEGKLVEQIAPSDDKPAVIVLDRTPFYGESGGQTGDHGRLTAPGILFDVIDTQKDGEFTLHIGFLRSGTLKLSDAMTATVDAVRRAGIQRAHSCTHVLHHALQKHLGRHAQQQGSKVENDLLRFDFSHSQALSGEELKAIEEDVNQLVLAAQPVGWKRMPIDEARKTGAMMLFGEKYPDVVRVVRMGDFSQEFCGGTHVDNTGQIGLCRIVSEESVSAGTRRISAVTGLGVLSRLKKDEDLLRQAAHALRAPVHEVPQRVQGLTGRIRDLEKQLAKLQRKEAPSAAELATAAIHVRGVRMVAADCGGTPGNDLRALIDQLRKQHGPIAVLLASREDDKVSLVAGVSKELVERGLHAGNWVKAVAPIVGGSGGGRPDLAQAGGRDTEKIDQALALARDWMSEQLSALAQ